MNRVVYEMSENKDKYLLSSPKLPVLSESKDILFNVIYDKENLSFLMFLLEK